MANGKRQSVCVLATEPRCAAELCVDAPSNHVKEVDRTRHSRPLFARRIYACADPVLAFSRCIAVVIQSAKPSNAKPRRRHQRPKGPRRDKLCILAVVAGCDARRPTRRSASTASGGQRRSAPATASQNVQIIPARVLSLNDCNKQRRRQYKRDCSPPVQKTAGLVKTSSDTSMKLAWS
jgi:hypothetical protein